MDEKGPNISNFMKSHSLKNIVRAPARFMSDRPKTIDLILTNRTSNYNFQNTMCQLKRVYKIYIA